jgi:Cu-Zn family superoxide dismutase
MIARMLLPIAAALALAAPAMADTATVTLNNASGAGVGTIALSEGPHGVLLRLALKGIAPGEHAFHVHAVGKCEPPFTSAGGHFNPTARKHGMMAADGLHAGDMPNLIVPASAELRAEIVNTAITLEKGKPNSLYQPNGTAFVIHAGPDDYKSDPAGNAGDRIACGVVQ